MGSESIRVEYAGGARSLAGLVRSSTYLLLGVAGVFTLIPLVWLFCAAFKKPGDMWSYTFMPYGHPQDELVVEEDTPDGPTKTAFALRDREMGVVVIKVDLPEGPTEVVCVLSGREISGGSAKGGPVLRPQTEVLRLSLENGAWRVRPGPGAQSVAVNNETKPEHLLQAGDVLHIGALSLRYQEGHTPTVRNFTQLFTDPNFGFGRCLLNSFFLTSAGTSISLLLASLGGFALAKYNFRGKKALLVLMLATMMIPGSVLLAPSYELICKMGLMNSYLGILLPGAVGAFGMLLFRQAMLGVPDDLLEAARIDGCSEVRIYWNIVMPVVRPMSGAFCLMSFMGGWNSFLWPMIVLQSKELFTVPIALSQTIGLQGDNQYGLLMAGTLLGVLPPAVLFFLLQKEFIAGLTAGAVKG